MTTQENTYGYSAKIEELIIVAENSKGKPLFKDHDITKEPIGVVSDTEIVYESELDCLSVMAIIELKQDNNETEIRQYIEDGGFSATYSDGGFSINESDGTNLPPMEILFDAYRTNEIKLYLDSKEMSKLLNIPIYCTRIRRHAGFEVLTFFAVSLGSYLINKILDDIGLYERFKEYLLNVSEVSSSGKEANITVISPTVTE
ncbi:hypothetical protein P6N53_11595, partial [Desulforamulus aquiferis]|nr:hypothetical protein [Desulforamulus aquiferis]